MTSLWLAPALGAHRASETRTLIGQLGSLEVLSILKDAVRYFTSTLLVLASNNNSDDRQISLLISPMDIRDWVSTPQRRAIYEDGLSSCDANLLIEVTLCVWHLFHYLPFPTYNVMASLFLLPKGSNFHLRQYISYISFGNHGQLDDFPLFSI